MKKRETLSSNTLFNFTTKPRFFYDKLRHGFAPRFCLEDLSVFYGANKSKAFPMVCFCDIPVSQLKDHIWNYGKYGIGLTKEWGIKNKLHPVLYYPPEFSQIIEYFKSLKKTIHQLETLGEDGKRLSENAKIDYAHLVRYLKLYAGKENKQDIRFYDEKEWRYLPMAENGDKFFLDREIFDNQLKREEENRKIFTRKIDFKADDIKFLVVPNEKEAEKLISQLYQLGNEKRFTSGAITHLTRRIITVEEIENDF
jgi:Putative abortive phage resistance protein AbiGi, antitoxin